MWQLFFPTTHAHPKIGWASGRKKTRLSKGKKEKKIKAHFVVPPSSESPFLWEEIRNLYGKPKLRAVREAARVRDEDTSIRVWFPRFGNTACGQGDDFQGHCHGRTHEISHVKKQILLKKDKKLTFAASVTVRLACSNLSGTSKVPLSKHCK